MREKILNILKNLTALEKAYLEQAPKTLDFDAFETYRGFLDSFFIKSHRLAGVYWPQHTFYVPKSIREMPVLDDQLLFLTGHDIALGKQINFPSAFLHASNYYNCVYVLSGSAVLNWEEETFSLTQGDFFLIAPGSRYCLNAAGNSIAVHVMIRRSYIADHYASLFKSSVTATQFFHETLAPEPSRVYLFYHLRERQPVTEHILDMYAEYLWSDSYSPELMEHHLYMIFLYLLRYGDDDAKTNVTVNLLEKNFNTVINYLNANYRTASLDLASRELHFSKQYLCRIVKNYSGQTFTELLTSIRINAVKSHLTQTDLRLEDIAELTGFSDAAYLSRVFKKREGISPSQFQKTKLPME